MAIFYTKTGDDGYTGILGAGRVAKFDTRLEALGTIDEANSAFGLSRASTNSGQTAATVLAIQRDLYKLMTEIAATEETAGFFQAINESKVLWLENEIEHYTSLVKMPGEFIVPGDSLSGAYLDLARTVVRRGERRVAELLHLGQIQNEEVLHYLNRLSSLCFALEIYENQISGRNSLTLTKIREGP
jgi:cob(I)alamin adenosyltransferase